MLQFTVLTIQPGIIVTCAAACSDSAKVDIVNMHQKNCKVGTRREIRTLEL